MVSQIMAGRRQDAHDVPALRKDAFGLARLLMRQYLSRLRWKLRRALTGINTAFPNGHFYSPVCDPRALHPESLWPAAAPAPQGIDFNDASHLEILRHWFPRHVADFAYPEQGGDDAQLTHFYCRNSQFTDLDALTLFVFLRELAPRRMVEVGSGYSSLLMADVNQRFLHGRTHITCIEPYPRAFLQQQLPGINEVRVQTVQSVPLSEFEALESGDILFIDSSHVVKTGSDVVYLFFEVLPRLRRGVIIHVHDVFLPEEYPKAWVVDENRSWNEQYLLRALMMYSTAFETLFACHYARLTHADAVAKALARPDGQPLDGGSFWLRRT